MTADSNPATSAAYRTALTVAQAKVTGILEKYPAFFPVYTRKGKWQHRGETWTDWTAGFLVGQMWIFFRQTGDPCWRECADFYCELLKPRRRDRAVHDLGFIFLNSWWPRFQHSADPEDEQIVLEAGQTLALRFQEPGGYLASFLGPQSLFIDIMMNVPLIFLAGQRLDNPQLIELAHRHCQTTQRTLVRPDGSTAHEGLFEEGTGTFLGQSTQQGLSAESCWARGLAWSLYGFAQCHSLTSLPSYLETAEQHAAYWLAHVPADGVPYWDFQADVASPPPLGAQRDSSAAAIAASGLLTLAELTPAQDRAQRYREHALKTLQTLCEPEYLSSQETAWEGTLKHGVYHTHKKLGVDESVMWGDFFFVEALNKALMGLG